MAGSAARRRRRYSASKGKSSTNRLHTNKLLIRPDFGSVIMEWAADRIPHRRISVTAPVMAPLLEWCRSAVKRFKGGKLGLPGRTRTGDPQLRRLLLCPTELRGGVHRCRGAKVQRKHRGVRAAFSAL